MGRTRSDLGFPRGRELDDPGVPRCADPIELDPPFAPDVDGVLAGPERAEAVVSPAREVFIALQSEEMTELLAATHP
jgi:hypothetical protein